MVSEEVEEEEEEEEVGGGWTLEVGEDGWQPQTWGFSITIQSTRFSARQTFYHGAIVGV